MGEIHNQTQFWKDELEADKYVMSILENGFRLSFGRSKLPEFYKEKNNKSAEDDMEFVLKEVHKLEIKGCVVRTSMRPRLINPLSVAIKKASCSVSYTHLTLPTNREV